MEVNSISPAPSFSAFLAHQIASSFAGSRPPLTKTSPFDAETFFASIATTMHWLPNLFEAALISSGFFTAAVLIETLSAPAFSIVSMSSRLLIPPPTVKGIKTFFATFLTISTTVFLFSWEAVMSRNTSSSAPSSEYFFPSSTGSPAFFSSTKFVPFTTRLSFTSRQGMILLASINPPPEEIKAEFAAFFRVKLHRHDVSVFHGAGKLPVPVNGLRSHNAFVLWHNIVRIHQVHESFPQNSVFRWLYFIPAYLRGFSGGKLF